MTRLVVARAQEALAALFVVLVDLPLWNRLVAAMVLRRVGEERVGN